MKERKEQKRGRAGSRRWVVAAMTGWVVFGAPLPEVQADGEAWTSFEARLPLAQPERFFDKVAARVIHEVRFRGRSDGLGQMLVRPGVRLDFTDWFYLVAQPALYLSKGDDGEFFQGARAELEPHFTYEWGDIEFTDRQRFAYRWQTDEVTWYYRNMLRMNYEAGAVRPFVWGEALLELFDFHIDEYRIMGGIELKPSESTTFEIGYMFRAREEDEGWMQDHVGAFYLIFDGWE